MTPNELKALAIAVKNEVGINKNTSSRIGNILEEIVKYAQSVENSILPFPTIPPSPVQNGHMIGNNGLDVDLNNGVVKGILKYKVASSGIFKDVNDKFLEQGLALDAAGLAANLALNKVADWASDSVLTPIEKQAALKEWSIILQEFDITIQQADRYSVPYVQYVASKNALDTYLFVTNNFFADLTTTTTDIDGTIFRLKFATYYAERALLLNVIAQRAKEYVGYSIAGIQIGGRNLLHNTSSSVKYVTISNGFTFYFFSGKNDLSTLSLAVGDWITLSFFVYDILSAYSPKAAFQLTINGVDTEFIASQYYFPDRTVFSIQIPAGTTAIAPYVKLATPAVGDINFGYRELKLEKGNKATDWTPAPEDVQWQINETNDYISALESNLQDQIDGVIDSWFYDYTPTSTNFPAVGWDTLDLKKRHVGDTFTNTSTYPAPDAGMSWRWLETYQGSGLYSWKPIADSDAVKALIAASTAKDIADGKRRVFTAQPTTPYDLGDLWAQGSVGDLMRCIKGRVPSGTNPVPYEYGVGTYNISDWEKASKYTDNTLAQSALNAANNAALSAGVANTLLAQWADDNQLNPSEKQSTLKEWNIIVAEKAQIDAQANIYSVGKDLYQAKYNNLNDFLHDVNNPLLSDLTTTSTINGAIFRSKFASYYLERQTLLNAIAVAAKDFVGTAINGIQIGGRNLLHNTSSSVKYVTISNGNSYYFLSPLTVISALSLSVGDWVTLSFYVHDIVNGYNPRAAFQLTVNGVDLFYEAPTYYYPGKSVFSIQIPGGTTAIAPYVKLATPAVGNINFGYRELKLEKGNKATDWEASSDYLIDAIVDGSVRFVGGIGLANIMMLGNPAGDVKTGLSGMNDNIGFWTGGTYQDATDDKNSAFKSAKKTGGLDRKDGAGHRAKGNLAWNELGQIFIGNEKDKKEVSLSPEILSSLSTYINKTSTHITITNTSPITVKRTYPYPEYYTAEAIINESNSSVPFVLTDDAIVKINVSASHYTSNITSTKYYSSYVRIKKIAVLDGEIDTIVINNQSSTSAGSSLQGSYLLTKGKYVIEAMANTAVDTGSENPYGSFFLASIVWKDLKFSYIPMNTTIAPDGIACVKDDETYFYMTQEFAAPYFLEGRGKFRWLSSNGQYGIEITNAGIKKIVGGTPIDL